MVERLPYFVLAILVVVLTGWGIRRRLRRGQVCDRAFVSKLAWAATGLSMACVGTVYPAVWFWISWTWHGGGIDANMPPG